MKRKERYTEEQIKRYSDANKKRYKEDDGYRERVQNQAREYYRARKDDPEWQARRKALVAKRKEKNNLIEAK